MPRRHRRNREPDTRPLTAKQVVTIITREWVTADLQPIEPARAAATAATFRVWRLGEWTWRGFQPRRRPHGRTRRNLERYLFWVKFWEPRTPDLEPVRFRTQDA
jgi:hypothetical protein